MADLGMDISKDDAEKILKRYFIWTTMVLFLLICFIFCCGLFIGRMSVQQFNKVLTNIYPVIIVKVLVLVVATFVAYLP